MPVLIPSSGWDKVATTANDLRDVADRNAGGLTVHVAGPAGLAADDAKAFQGIDGTLLFATLVVVIVILLLTYRSPILWLLPVISAGVALFAAQGADLPAGQARRADRQRAERRHPHGAGLRRRHRLRAAAGRPLPRGAAPPRGPARGDGASRCTAPARRSSPAPHRRRRHDLPAGRRAQLDRGPRPGRAPSASVVALVAMLTLLPALLTICGRWLFWPVRPSVRLARADRDRASGRGSAAASRAGRGRSGSATALVLGVHGARPVRPQRPRLYQRQQLHQRAGLHPSARRCSTPHFPAGVGDPVHRADQGRPLGRRGQRAERASRASAACRRRPGHARRRRAGQRACSPTPRTARPRETRWCAHGRPCTRCPAPTLRSAARPRSRRHRPCRRRTTATS